MSLATSKSYGFSIPPTVFRGLPSYLATRSGSDGAQSASLVGAVARSSDRRPAVPVRGGQRRVGRAGVISVVAPAGIERVGPPREGRVEHARSAG